MALGTNHPPYPPNLATHSKQYHLQYRYCTTPAKDTHETPRSPTILPDTSQSIHIRIHTILYTSDQVLYKYGSSY